MIDKRIGKRVKQARERLGITQEDLAEKTGLTTNYISTVERGMSDVYKRQKMEFDR